MMSTNAPSIRLKPGPTRRAIHRRGLSVTAAAEAMGCSRRTMTALVNGEPIRVTIANKFAKLLRDTPELGLDALIADDEEAAS